MTELKQAKYFDTATLEAPSPTLKTAAHFVGDMVIDTQPQQLHLSKTDNRWWWRLAWFTLLAIVVLSVWQWCHTVVQSWQQSVFYGGMLSLISLSVIVLLLVLSYRELKLWRRLQRNQAWQSSAKRISNSVQYGEADKLCQAVAASLPDNPAIKNAVASWRNAVKDEHSDEERLALFQRFVLSELDLQAQQLIYRAATDTSLAVAISPFALADMLLVLWRSSRLLRELAQLYGGAIGQLRSLVLLKQLFSALLWAGGSELALDMASDVISSELTATLSARAGQGLIAGLLVARLGNLAQQHLRPLPANASAKVSLKALAKALVARFNNKTQSKADITGQ